MKLPWPRREVISSRLRGGDQRGSVAVSVLLIPLAILAVFGTIQLALVIHGRNVAAAAAEDALFTASQYGADEGDGEAAGYAIFDLYEAIDSPNVNVNKGDRTVTVVVTGTMTTPLSLFASFEIEVSGPVEDYIAEGDR